MASNGAQAQPASELTTDRLRSSDIELGRTNVQADSYILGPGDKLQIELLDLPELSGNFTIGPDGTLYLPRLRALYAEGYTIEELKILLTEQFAEYVLQPQVYIRPTGYRPIRIYVSGEVRRPGFYTLSGVQTTEQELSQTASLVTNNNLQIQEEFSPSIRAAQKSISGSPFQAAIQFPTVFDAIRAAQGITPYSDLGKVEVTRKRPSGQGGGKIRTTLNFISLITDGNESQNIRLLDGDVVKVAKSTRVLKEQLLQARQTNLSPQFLEVFVSGRVKKPGGKVLPQGSTLTQAIDVSGGLKILHGSVEFIRFNREGTVDRRIFRYKPSAPADDYRNPVLMAGDVIRIRESPLSAASEVIGEVTAPALGIYSIYSLMGDFVQ